MSRLPPPPDLPDFAEELTARLADRDRLAALRAAVQALPPRERDVLICVWSGLDSTEAAQALGVPEGTVRARLSRSRRRLRARTDDARPAADAATADDAAPDAIPAPGEPPSGGRAPIRSVNEGTP